MSGREKEVSILEKLIIVISEMARKLNKSTKQILSVLFHLAVLGSMVLLYDAGNAVVKKLRGEMSGKSEEEEKSAKQSSGDDFAAMMAAKKNKDLAKAVDQKEGGYVFRSDVAFPPHLRVISRETRKEGEGKSAKSSVRDTVYEKAGKTMRITVSGKSVDFRSNGKTWEAVPSKNVAIASWGNGLQAAIPVIQVENGLLARSRWFGKERIKVGKQIELADASLALAFDDTRKGKVTLTFLGMQSVHGHPCGVFEVSGNLVKDDSKDSKGRIFRDSLEIKTGKVRLSLIYPVVIGYELTGEMTTETDEGAEPAISTKKPVELKIIREWIAVAAKLKGTTTAPVKK